jgi:hypothetical protein
MGRLTIPIEEATPQQIIDFYQRYIIIHSHIYYDMDNNLISDKKYDEVSRLLVSYKEKYPEEWKNSMYYKQFGDEYTGATGMGLYDDLDPEQQLRINYIINSIYRALRRDQGYKVTVTNGQYTEEQKKEIEKMFKEAGGELDE